MIDNDLEATEWYRKYRPRNLNEVVGQGEGIQILKDKLAQDQLPHVTLLTGPSGVGKTTIARILKKKLGCHDFDYKEIQCATVSGLVDEIREIIELTSVLPIGGSCKMWLLDEIQATNASKQAQDALLKILEDTPSHVYFILATTHPEKLSRAMRTRCANTITLKPLEIKDLESVLKRIAIKEGVEVTDEEIIQIAIGSSGSARWAINELQRISSLPNNKERVKHISSYIEEDTGAELCRLLMNPRSTWKEIATVLENNKSEPEELRRGILKYAGAVLLGNDKDKRDWAYGLITRLEMDIYNCLKPIITAALYDIFGKRGI